MRIRTQIGRKDSTWAVTLFRMCRQLPLVTLKCGVTAMGWTAPPPPPRSALSWPEIAGLRFEKAGRLKVTEYFRTVRIKPDRAMIEDAWIARVIECPQRSHVQADGRIRLWAAIRENDGRYLRVILLPDRETVHNAFFDRGGHEGSILHRHRHAVHRIP